jgi:arylsulfatase
MRRNNRDVEAVARRRWLGRFLCIFSPVAFVVAASLLYVYQVSGDNLSLINNLHLIKNLSQDTQYQTLDRNKPNLTTTTIPTTRQQRRRAQEQEPLNIVLFYADDWTMKILGKLNPLVQTPNIDRMADNGMLFTNNCVTTSVCWMSRATLMTGVYAARHRQTDPPKEEMFKTNPWNETLFPLLRQAGYYTGIVGKWHAPQTEPYMSMAFDWKNCYFGFHWMEREKVVRHVTDLNREDALQFLKDRPKHQKFALKVSFFATHAWDGHSPSYEPTNASRRDLYNDVTIPTPKTATEEHWQRLPHFFNTHNAGRARWRQRFEPAYYQESIRDLYRMATEVDTVVGDIIEELKKQGVYNNTVLIFTTDNGNLHGEHGLAEKWYPFEESIRVPLVIQDPRMPQEVRGTTSDAWTLNIDLAPTMLEVAKVKPSRFMQGRDIAHLYLDENPTWRKDFFYEYNRGDPVTAKEHKGSGSIDASFALITDEWKYIYWPEYDYEQLFHRSVDPYDEWDMLNKSMIQTTDDIYSKMKARYEFLKDWV